jgi:uncharacterized protein (TIGR02598 family)
MDMFLGVPPDSPVMKTLSLTTNRFSPPDFCPANRGAGRARLGGFTLVEVTLAIGIISFAFVAMFGMLPVGLNVSRQAMDTTIEAQIVQRMKTQALQTDFSRLDELSSSEELFFDDQGKPVAPDQSVFRARFSGVSAATKLPDGTSTSRLKTVTITVENSKGVSEGVGTREPRKFTTLIPDNGL